jgi:hypothetical protein
MNVLTVKLLEEERFIDYSLILMLQLKPDGAPRMENINPSGSLINFQ